MKIGIDIDEVFVKFMDGFLSMYNQENQTKYSLEDFSSYNLWDIFEIPREESYEWVEKFYLTAAFENLKLVEGAKEAIKILSNKHQIVFITSRPIETKNKTNKFLKKHLPKVEFELIHSGDYHHHQAQNKGNICIEKNICLHIEDNHPQALGCAEKGVSVLLLEKPWNKDFKEHENITRVKDWKEILEKLNDN